MAKAEDFAIQTLSSLIRAVDLEANVVVEAAPRDQAVQRKRIAPKQQTLSVSVYCLGLTARVLFGLEQRQPEPQVICDIPLCGLQSGTGSSDAEGRP